MDYSLSLTRHATETLKAHLLGDQSREQMAVTLCGINRLHRELRLLAREVILLPPDAFQAQTATRLELRTEVQAFIHRRAHDRDLIQVDWHSHPGGGERLGFSATDDHHEAAQAAYLAHRMAGVPYGSVAVNDGELDARLWTARSRKRRDKAGNVRTITYAPEAQPIHVLLAGDMQRRIPLSARRRGQGSDPGDSTTSARFDRQVRAFGQASQRKVGVLRVGIVGVGGLGSALVDHLARLGVRNWVLVDPDVVELANLNRLVNATVSDAQKARPKVFVARSTIRQSNPKATVRAMQTDIYDPDAQRALKACDLLVVATDNHASRMALNRLAVQYLIPLVHTGFHVGVQQVPPVSGERKVEDVSGEYAIPDLGRWCLHCAGIIDPQQAGWELAPPAQREVLRRGGYVDGTPAPAVRHLDGVVASLAATEIHNLVHAFKPQQRYLAYDALRTELVPLTVTPSDGCPVCSPDNGVLGLGDLEPLPDYRRQATPPPVLPPPPSAPRIPSGRNGGSLQLATPIVDPAPANSSRQRRARAHTLPLAPKDPPPWTQTST